MDNFFLTLYLKCVIWLFVKEVFMKTGDIVLYEKRKKVYVGIICNKWSDERWIIRPLSSSQQFVKRHENYLTPIKDIKKYLDISKKI